MKKIDYSEWKKRKHEFTQKLLKVENEFQGHAVGNRPRDPEKERILIKMDKARWARYIESGKIVKLGPRRWKWRIGPPDRLKTE